MGTIINDLDSINANLYALTNYIVGGAPSGTITITENGTGIDVSSYATADVNVSGGASVGGLVEIVKYGGDMDFEPSVGDYVYITSDLVHKVSLSGSDIAVSRDSNAFEIHAVAAMSTITSIWGPAFPTTDNGIYGYVVTLAGDGDSEKTIETVTPCQLNSTVEWAVYDENTGTYQPSTADNPADKLKRYVFDVPSLGEGEALMLRYSFYWD